MNCFIEYVKLIAYKKNNNTISSDNNMIYYLRFRIFVDKSVSHSDKSVLLVQIIINKTKFYKVFCLRLKFFFHNLTADLFRTKAKNITFFSE